MLKGVEGQDDQRKSAYGLRKERQQSFRYQTAWQDLRLTKIGGCFGS